ncbi:hypothetical protein H4Q26_011823 [Puccinia striiformis f. sp. tritici PST-130]|nr:hypothetical protein H4Q26_011823 [Puccinia striiformis f. sp. tritici PST-130]
MGKWTNPESNHNTTNPMPTLASNRAKSIAGRRLTGPTGRFELDLGAEGNDDRDPSQAATTNTKGPPPVMAEIMERCSNPPNNHSDPTFRADAMPGTISSTSLNPQTSIPPWELRRLASRHSSQKSQQTPTDKPSIPIAQNKSCCDVTPTGGSAKGTIMATEKCQISSENEALLSQMSPDEILREQAAIKAQLMQSNPELLTKLLTKFNMDSPAHQGPSDTSTLPFRSRKSRNMPSPLKFDWNGIRVADLEDPHQTDRSSDETFMSTYQCLYVQAVAPTYYLFCALSTNNGIQNRHTIVVRYLNSSNHGLDDAEMAILTEELNGASLEILTIGSTSYSHLLLGPASQVMNASIATTIIDFNRSDSSRLDNTRDSAKVSEEIVRGLFPGAYHSSPRRGAMAPKQYIGLEVPDLSAFELLLELAKSSRSCSRSILDRALLTPMLSVAEGLIPVPNDHIMGVLIHSMRYQFELISVFGGYGLGANLRTTLDPLLRTTSKGLYNILQMQSLTLLPPRPTESPRNLHSSQLSSNYFKAGSSVPTILTSAIHPIASHGVKKIVSKETNIGSCLASLESLMPQLETIFKTTTNNVIPYSHEDCKSQPDLFSQFRCRLAFEVEGLSLLPWALSVCHISSDTTSNLERFLLAGLLVRNSDGMVVGDLLAETLNRCQSRVNAQFQNASKHSTQLIELSRLSPIFNDYIDQSSPSTRISDPSPHQLKIKQVKTRKHLASASTTSQLDQTLILDRCSVWKTVMTAIIATTSQTYRLNHQDTEEPLESIFEDEACADLIIRLMDTPNRLAPPRSQTNGFKPNSQPEAIKVQESEDVELYTIFTDILATFDSTSFGNHILKHMKIGTEDVISLNDSGLKEYLYPLEDSAQMLHLFAETLTNPSTSINSREYPFLFLYLIHHLSSQIYNSILEDRIRIDLLKVILNKAKDDEICQAILYYDQPINSSHDIPGLADSLSIGSQDLAGRSRQLSSLLKKKNRQVHPGKSHSFYLA